jgi:hypothetical protein
MYTVFKAKRKYYFRPPVAVECNERGGPSPTSVSGPIDNFAVAGALYLYA